MLKLDDRDLKILAVLAREGRIAKADLARRVNLTPTPLWERLKRLEDAGVIAGYRAEIALAEDRAARRGLRHRRARRPHARALPRLRGRGRALRADHRRLVARRRHRLPAARRRPRHRRLPAADRHPARQPRRHRPLLHLRRHPRGEDAGRPALRRAARRRLRRPCPHRPAAAKPSAIDRVAPRVPGGPPPQDRAVRTPPATSGDGTRGTKAQRRRRRDTRERPRRAAAGPKEVS